MSYHRAVNFWLFLAGPNPSCWLFPETGIWAQMARTVNYSGISVPSRPLDVCPMAWDHCVVGGWWFQKGKKRNTVKHQPENEYSRDGKALISTSDCCTFSAVRFLLFLPNSFCVLLYPVKQVGVFPSQNHKEATTQPCCQIHLFNFPFIWSLLFTQCFTVLCIPLLSISYANMALKYLLAAFPALCFSQAISKLPWVSFFISCECLQFFG